MLSEILHTAGICGFLILIGISSGFVLLKIQELLIF
jgi:hypothetical protein